jgi:hypothetical protein
MQAEAALMCAYFRAFRLAQDETAPLLNALREVDLDLIERWL